jgi:hypothetical protein
MHDGTPKYSTTDTAFAAWVEWKKQHSIVPHPKVSGQASFVIIGVTDSAAADYWHEYIQTEFYQFDCRRLTLTRRIPRV